MKAKPKPPEANNMKPSGIPTVELNLKAQPLVVNSDLLKDSIQLNPFERMLHDFMAGVPEGHKVTMIHGRGGIIEWTAKPEDVNRFTHRWNGKEWEPI